MSQDNSGGTALLFLFVLLAVAQCSDERIKNEKNHEVIGQLKAEKKNDRLSCKQDKVLHKDAH